MLPQINVMAPWFDNLVAQLGHFGWGCMLVLAFAIHQHPWYGVAAVLIWALPKEFLFDKFVERQSFKDNLFDFSMYVAGVGAALLIIYWR